MKLEIMDTSNYILFLKKKIIQDINFSVKEELEEYFKDMFQKLKTYYDIEIKGYYNIKVYIDKYYGVVLDIQKESIEYYDYFDSSVEMRITSINTDFLYEIDDLSVINFFEQKIKISQVQDKIYLQIIQPLSLKEELLISEFTKVVYDSDNIKIK